MTFEKIIQDLKNKVYYPIYFLHGDESYYIDKVSDYIEQNVLSDSEKEFNQTIVYGKELDALTLLSYAKRYPMMSNYQVIIVKEAQDIKSLSGKEEKGKDDRNPLLDYVLNPQKSTILVFCYKYKTLDKRTKLSKALEKNAVIFESKKLYENKIPDWVIQYVQSRGFKINPKAAMMVAEYLGNDLSKITNEIEKLLLNPLPTKEITVELIEENIGISKDFNIFELHSALGKRNVYKANQIVNYFAANPKSSPMVLTIPQLFSYFIKILTYHKLAVKSRNEVASALGVNPYFIGEYETAAKAYPEHKVLSVISTIREYDLKSKGVNSGTANEGDMLKELVWKILH
jgi:DNA polymerase III subunit delta